MIDLDALRKLAALLPELKTAKGFVDDDHNYFLGITHGNYTYIISAIEALAPLLDGTAVVVPVERVTPYECPVCDKEFAGDLSKDASDQACPHCGFHYRTQENDAAMIKA